MRRTSCYPFAWGRRKGSMSTSLANSKTTLSQSVPVQVGTPYMPTKVLATPLSAVPPSTLANNLATQITDLEAQQAADMAANTTSISTVAEDVVAQSVALTDAINGVAATIPTIPAAPLQLTSVSATESPVKQQTRTFSEVTVSFVRPTDANYASTRIWFTGYKGNTHPVLMVAATVSPIDFLVETTGETVTITAQTVGSDG